VVEDRTLIDEVLKGLEAKHSNVEHVFQQVVQKYCSTLEGIDDPYLRERVVDIQDVAHRVIRNLLGKAPQNPAAHSHPHIVVAHNLTPSDTAQLNRELEVLIRQCPEQYLWGYNRYKVPSGAEPPPA